MKTAVYGVLLSCSVGADFKSLNLTNNSNQTLPPKICPFEVEGLSSGRGINGGDPRSGEAAVYAAKAA